MQLPEVKTLLDSVNGIDARISVTRERMEAWSDMLNEKAKDLTLADAQQIMRDHYSQSHEMLTLDIFVAAHKRIRSMRQSITAAKTAKEPEKRVPMPEWFKAAVYDMQRPQANGDGEPMSIGEIFTGAAMFAGADTVADPLDAHCYREGCSCEHIRCYRGWVDSDSDTSPCRMCRPGLALVLDEIAPLGSRQPHDQKVLESIEHRRELLGWSGIK